METWRRFLKEGVGEIGQDVKAPVPVSRGLEKVEENKDKVWVFFDTETTGFGPKKNAITEIAGIAVDPNNWESKPRIVRTFGDVGELKGKTDPKIFKTFSQKAKLTPYVRGRDPESESGKETKKVLAMTQYGEKNPPKGRFIEEKQLIKNFYDWLESLGGPENVVLVIQNAKFDMKMISLRYNADEEGLADPALGAVGGDLPVYPIIDTIPLMKNFLIPFWITKANEGDKEAEEFLAQLKPKRGKRYSTSQGPVATALGIPIIGWHSAIEDVKMLMNIFQRVVEIIRAGGDVDIRPEYEKTISKPKKKKRKKRTKPAPKV